MDSPCDVRVLIYEPRVEGHHLGFLRMVTEDLVDAGYEVSVAIDRRAGPLRQIRAEMAAILDRVTIVDACDEAGRPTAGGKIATIAACRERTGADIIFLPNFDEVASSMLRRAAVGVMPPAALRGRLSGIYHRPEFLSGGGISLNRWLKRRGFERLLRDGWISHLLLFDTHAREAFKQRWPDAPLFHMAIPFPDNFAADREQARRALDLPRDKRVFLFYGAAYRRKGLPLAVDAMLSLPQDTPAFLLCAGRQASNPTVTRKLGELVRQGRARVIDRYVSTEEERQLFAAADAVLLPYRRHLAGSGVLGRAVGAERPVIASDEGLIGRFIRDHGLGLAVPSGDVTALSDAIERIAHAASADLAKWQAAARTLAPQWSRGAFRNALIGAFDFRLPPAARTSTEG